MILLIDTNLFLKLFSTSNSVYPNNEDFGKIQYEFNKNVQTKANGNFPEFISPSLTINHTMNN